MTNFAESVVEDAALSWLENLDYTVKHVREIAPGQLLATQKAVVAKNATVQIPGNMQKMHFALRSPRNRLTISKHRPSGENPAYA